jgi:hypothetical protein
MGQESNRRPAVVEPDAVRSAAFKDVHEPAGDGPFRGCKVSGRSPKFTVFGIKPSQSNQALLFLLGVLRGVGQYHMSTPASRRLSQWRRTPRCLPNYGSQRLSVAPYGSLRRVGIDVVPIWHGRAGEEGSWLSS